MATLPSPSGSSTVCQYCSNSYHDPRILDCLHSYCLQCITTIHDEEGTTNSTVTCPSCHHPTHIPDEGGVASLPANIHLVYETEQDSIVKKVTMSPPPSCESCEEESAPSVAYCKDCNDMLCSECWRMHKKLKITKSHSTYSLDDLREKSQPELVNEIASLTCSVPMCPHHDNHILDFYCTKCSIPVCVRCAVDGHSNNNGHTLQEIEVNIFQSKATQITSDVEELPKKNELEQVTKRIDETKMKVQNRKDKVDGMICESFAKLHQIIDQRKAELLAVNTRIASSKETRLSIQKEDIQKLMESTVHCLSVSSIATSEYSNVQLLAIANTIHNRAIELRKRCIATPLDPCDTPLITAEFNIEELEKLITQFMVVADSSSNGPNCSAIVPRQRLGVGATMKVKVITQNGQGEVLTVGGATVRGRLSYNGGVVNDSLGITDNGDGTYFIDVTTADQQLGQHQLSITVNGLYIQGSPFSLDIVPQRDYTKLNKAVQTITGITKPRYIAFTDNGDMYITTFDDHYIHVYDASGNKKTTIGSGNFESPRGIDINGEVVYVAEWGGHKIHKLTTGGEFIDTFGKEGSAIGQFNGTWVVKISPDGKVYVVDRGNDRVQVFNPDWSVSHVIDGTVSGDGCFKDPNDIAFDPFSDVHISAFKSSSVVVFTSSGQFIRQYGDKSNIRGPGGIAIDPSGYSLVTSFHTGTLCIFDPNGILLQSLGGFDHPFGVSISPVDGSVWVADNGNEGLMKYCRI